MIPSHPMMTSNDCRWAIAIPGFAVRLRSTLYCAVTYDRCTIQGCRLILNMSHLLECNRNSPSHTHASRDVVDTLIFTNDVTTGLCNCTFSEFFPNNLSGPVLALNYRSEYLWTSRHNIQLLMTLAHRTAHLECIMAYHS